MSMESHGGMITDRGEPKNSKKNLSQCHFLHHMTDLGVCCERPVTDLLNCAWPSISLTK
jgi:hypothetical protein